MSNAQHHPTITRPAAPGEPYMIVCACGYVAEAFYPIAALVGAYAHKETGQ